MIFSTLESKYSWLAGLLDADGYIGISQHKDRKSKRQFSWRPNLKVVNTKKILLEEIKRQFGCGTISTSGKCNYGTKKQAYQISFSSNDIRKILPEVKRFLVIKSRQSDLLLAMLIITADHRKRGYDIDFVDSQITPLWEEVRILNSGRLKWKINQ